MLKQLNNLNNTTLVHYHDAAQLKNSVKNVIFFHTIVEFLHKNRCCRKHVVLTDADRSTPGKRLARVTRYV